MCPHYRCITAAFIQCITHVEFTLVLHVVFLCVNLLVTYNSILGWVYKVHSCQYLISICKLQGLVYTNHVNKQIPNYPPVLLDLYQKAGGQNCLVESTV